MATGKAALLRTAARPAMARAGACLSAEVGLVACWGDARRVGRKNSRRQRARASMRQRRLRSVRFRSRRLAPVLIGLCLAQPLSGCFIDTEHPDPELETADKYKYGPRQPYLALPALDWWRNFQSAELTKLMELAQTANLDIAVAVAQIIQADAQVRVSGAPLLPNITANFINTRDRTSPASIAPSTTTTVRRGSLISDLHTANLSASYVLDFWGQTRATVLANEESAIASRFNREVVAITTEVAVADAYFQVLGAQDRLRIANNNLREANRVLQVIRERLSGRNRLATRNRSAGKSGRPGARQHPAARHHGAAESGSARRAGGPRAGEFRRARRQYVRRTLFPALLRVCRPTFSISGRTSAKPKRSLPRQTTVSNRRAPHSFRPSS